MRDVLGFTPRCTDRRGVRRLRPLADAGRGPVDAAAVDRPRDAGRASPRRGSAVTEPAVGDAEIIPIGTRGRPGRGSGTADSRRRPRATSPAPRAAEPPARQPGPAAARHADERLRRSRARRAAAAGADDAPRRGVRAGAPRRHRAGHRWRHPGRRLARRVPVRGQGGLRRRLGAAARAGSWPSCAAGSPATTSSTSTASTPSSPSGSSWRRCARSRRSGSGSRSAALENIPADGRRAGGLQPLRHGARWTA